MVFWDKNIYFFSLVNFFPNSMKKNSFQNFSRQEKPEKYIKIFDQTIEKVY